MPRYIAKRYHDPENPGAVLYAPYDSQNERWVLPPFTEENAATCAASGLEEACRNSPDEEYPAMDM